MKLTLDHARTALLHAQGLSQPPDSPAEKPDVLKVIQRMGVLQIDTINVVERSPYLVLWSRVGAYPLHWLTDLLAEKSLFEYWAHAACFLPIEDFGQYRRFMLDRRAKPSNGWLSWLDRNLGTVDHVRGVAHERGEVRSADFERTDGQKGGWWSWKVEKEALEYLFGIGELMVARRDRFQRVYGPQERIHPWDDATTPARADIYRDWVERTVRMLGVTPERWIADYFRLKRADAKTALKSLVRDGVVVPVTVGDEPEPWYAHRDDLGILEAITDGEITPQGTTLFSPFDPVIWDRARLLGLFGMDYKIEVYVPEPKRKYGYFSLPILHDGRMVGRLDPKAHRSEKRMEIRAIHLEPDVTPDDSLVDGLAQTLQRFAEWHRTPEVTVGKTDPKPLAAAIMKRLRK